MTQRQTVRSYKECCLWPGWHYTFVSISLSMQGHSVAERHPLECHSMEPFQVKRLQLHWASWQQGCPLQCWLQPLSVYSSLTLKKIAAMSFSEAEPRITHKITYLHQGAYPGSPKANPLLLQRPQLWSVWSSYVWINRVPSGRADLTLSAGEGPSWCHTHLTSWQNSRPISKAEAVKCRRRFPACSLLTLSLWLRLSCCRFN